MFFFQSKVVANTFLTDKMTADQFPVVRIGTQIN